MFKILNRFAWILSFCFSSLIFYYLAPDGTRFLFIIPFLIVAFLIKGVFLSSNFIKTNLEGFVEKLMLESAKLKDNNLVSNQQQQTVGITDQEKLEENYLDLAQTSQELKSENIQNIDMKIPNDIKVNYIFSEIPPKEEDTAKQQDYSPTEVQKEPGIFQKFFSENLFAKIGGILIFLGMMFFLALIYTHIGPLGKITIGLLFGIGVYFVGLYLDKKGFEQESRVLLGVGILINYLVILGGRYLIKPSGMPYMTETITLLFLVANTLFAIITSLKFNSKTLLIFSFVFAYVNPFLVGGSADTPYTLVSYSMIVSIGIFALAYFKSNLGEKSIYENLLYIGLIGGNITILIAPFATSFQWIFKLIALAVLSIVALALALYKKDTKNITGVLLSAYVFFMFLLFYGNMTIKGFYTGFDIYFSYMFFLFLFMLVGVYFVIFSTITVVWWMLFSPLVLLSGISLFGDFIYLVPTFAIFTVFFLIIYSLVYKKLDTQKSNMFFIVLLVYALICGSNISSFSAISLGVTNFYIVLGTLFLFLGFSYYFSKKDGLENLYLIGTAGTGIIFLSIVKMSGLLMRPSIIAIVLFSLANIIMPFLNKKLLEGRKLALMGGIVTGMLFLLINARRFGHLHFSSLQTGFLFLILTAIYLILGFYFLNNWIQEKSILNESDKNVIYTYFASAILLFCIAGLFAFAETRILVPIVWLLVSNLIFFFFARFKDRKIYIAGLIVLIISLLYLLGLNIQTISNIPYMIVMSVSLVLSLYFINKNEFAERTSFDVIYIIGHIIILFIMSNVLDTNTFDYMYFAFTIYFFLLSIVNYYLGNKNIRYIHMLCLGVLVFAHIISFKASITRIDTLVSLGKLSPIYKLLDYFIIILNLLNVYFSRKNNEDLKLPIYYVGFVYFFIITTMVIITKFSNTFIITIYWGILALSLLFYGLQKDIIKYRTLGLYIIILTLLKVFFYDIWYGLANPIFKVLAFMILGAIMIYISTLYSKKIGKPMKEELAFENLKENN